MPSSPHSVLAIQIQYVVGRQRQFADCFPEVATAYRCVHTAEGVRQMPFSPACRCRLLSRAHRLVGDWVHWWRLLAPVWRRPRQAAGPGCITVATGPPGSCWSRAEAAVSPWQALCGMHHCTAAATTPGAAPRRGTLSKAARSAGAAVGPTLAGRGPPLGLARVQTRSAFCFSRHYIPGSSIHEH